MPNFIAIEIEDQKLLVASAKSSGRSYQITQLFEIEFEEDALGSEIGSQLKDMLVEHGVSRAELIGLVGRQDAEVRDMSVPPAPEDEMPDLVRFQARNVFASLNDNWLFDYVPFPRMNEEQQRVLAVAIPPQIKDRFDAIAEAAGLKLKRILFRPFALCDLFEGLLAGDENRLLVLPIDCRFDLMVTSGNQLVAARSFKVSSELDDTAVAKHTLGEIKRTLASTRSSLSGDILQIIVGGSKENWKELENEFKQSLELPIVFFSPLGCVDPPRFTASKMPERSERFAGTVGALVKEFKRSSHVVDFVNPRRPVVKKRDFTKLLIPLAAVGLFLLAAAGYGWYLLNEQSKKIDATLVELERERGFNKDTKQVLAEVAVLDKWMAGKVNWMDELAFISEKLLTPDDILISKFRGVENSRGFQISMTSHVSRDQENDNSWQESFGNRYKDPVFDKIEDLEAPAIKDHPVLRPFKLEQELNVASAVEKFNVAAKIRRDELAEATANDEQASTSGATE